ncbi:MAG: PAS domain S-box protein, partial [bacterium]|nr:PAS domain S-box protein [bacterium]
MMATEFFRHQLDYLYFVNGFAFILLASICMLLHQERTNRLPWYWLGLFGVLHGIHEWLEMLVVSLGDNLYFSSIRVGVLAVSFILVFEFGRIGIRKLDINIKSPARWIYIPLLAIALLGSRFGLSGFNASCRYTLGFIGTLYAAAALYFAGQREASRNRWLIFSAVSMVGYAVTGGIIVPKSVFLPASILNETSFVTVTGIPIQIFRTLFAILLVSFIWEYHQHHQRELWRQIEKKTRPHYGLQLTIVLLIILTSGWFLVDRVGKNAESREREHILNQAKIAAAAINPERFANLSGTLADLKNPDYIRLREQLILMNQSNPQLRWLYTMRLQNGKIPFIVDSIPEGEYGHVDSGQANYEQPPPELYTVFTTGLALTAGPYTDEWGSFVSGFAAIRDLKTQKVIGVLGIDIDAKDWYTMIATRRLAPIGVILFISLLITGFFIVRFRLIESAQRILASESNLQEAQSVAKIGSWILDVKTSRVTWSEELFRIFGLDPKQGAPSYPEEHRKIIHPEDMDKLDTAIHQAITEGKPYEIMLRVVRPNGELRYIMAIGKPRHAADGTVVQLFGTAQDITDRKLMEDALKQEREFIDAVITTVGALVVVLDRDGRIVRFNRACETTTGYKSDEVLGKPFWEFLIPPSELDTVLSGFRQLVSGTFPLDAFPSKQENHWITKDGRLRLISWTNTVLYDASGKVEYVIASGIDITERKQAELALKESEEKYRLIFNNVPLGIVHFDATGTVITCNDTLVQMLGSTKEKIIGLNLTTLPDKNMVIAVKKSLSGEFAHYEGDYRSVTSGKLVPIKVEYAPIILDDGTIIGGVGIIEDMTERKQAEETIRENELLFRTITTSAKDAIILMDNDGNISYWNQAAETIFGYRAAEILGKNLHATLAPAEYHAAHQAAFRKWQETGEGNVVGKTVELRARRKDGLEIPIELSLSSVLLKGRWHAVGVARDITERKRAEAEIYAAQQRYADLVNNLAVGVYRNTPGA